MLYQVKPLHKGDKITSDTMKNAVAAINKRINVLGVSEPEISIESGGGKHNIRVQLPGVKNQKKARKLLSTTANLSFRDVNDHLMLDGSDLVPGKAKVGYDDLNNPIVTLKLKSADKFAKVTRKISQMPPPNNRLVIWMDYQKGDSYKEE